MEEVRWWGARRPLILTAYDHLAPGGGNLALEVAVVPDAGVTRHRATRSRRV